MVFAWHWHVDHAVLLLHGHVTFFVLLLSLGLSSPGRFSVRLSSWRMWKHNSTLLLTVDGILHVQSCVILLFNSPFIFIIHRPLHFLLQIVWSLLGLTLEWNLHVRFQMLEAVMTHVIGLIRYVARASVVSWNVNVHFGLNVSAVLRHVHCHVGPSIVW